ncbi:MAG: hypothetical protein ACTSYA_01795 [Candidatus Kariarchaeaceae archaeon]
MDDRTANKILKDLQESGESETRIEKYWFTIKYSHSEDEIIAIPRGSGDTAFASTKADAYAYTHGGHIFRASQETIWEINRLFREKKAGKSQHIFGLEVSPVYSSCTECAFVEPGKINRCLLMNKILKCSAEEAKQFGEEYLRPECAGKYFVEKGSKLHQLLKEEYTEYVNLVNEHNDNASIEASADNFITHCKDIFFAPFYQDQRSKIINNLTE